MSDPFLGIRLTCTTGTLVAVPMVGGGNTVQSTFVRISNSGSVAACVAFGDNTVVATTNHYEVLPGTVEILTVTPSLLYASGITVSGTTTLQICRGVGESP